MGAWGDRPQTLGDPEHWIGIPVGRGAMDLHDLVRHEWREDHCLSRRSLIWIHEHAEPDDPHPLQTAIDQLRAERVDRLMP